MFSINLQEDDIYVSIYLARQMNTFLGLENWPDTNYVVSMRKSDFLLNHTYFLFTYEHTPVHVHAYIFITVIHHS